MLRVRALVAIALLALSVAAQATVDLRILRREELPALPGSANSYAFGDINGDGRKDFYISRRRPGSDVIVIACPAGGFLVLSNPGDASYASDDTKLIDIDGDGDLDIVSVGPPDGTGHETCRVQVNDGTGGLKLDGRLPARICGHVVVAGDLDGINGPDLFIGQVGSGQNMVLLNDGHGWFHEVIGSLPALPLDIQGAVMFDADNDGDLDIAVAQAEHASSLLLNDGSGNFTLQPWSCFPSDVLPSSAIAAGDLDHDGTIDLVYSGYQSGALIRQSRIMRNLGGGCFRQEPLPLVTNDAHAVCVADLDGDGDLDLAFACTGPAGGAVSPLVLVNDGSASFGASGWQGRPVAGSAIAAVDVDNDGDVDLWVGSPDRDHWYAGHERQLDAPLNPEIGMPYRLVITAAVARTVPRTSAILLIGSAFVQPRLPTDFGALGLRPDIIVPLAMDATGQVVLETPWASQGTILFQALILPGNSLGGARLTNLVGDTL